MVRETFSLLLALSLALGSSPAWSNVLVVPRGGGTPFSMAAGAGLDGAPGATAALTSEGALLGSALQGPASRDLLPAAMPLQEGANPQAVLALPVQNQPGLVRSEDPLAPQVLGEGQVEVRREEPSQVQPRETASQTRQTATAQTLGRSEENALTEEKLAETAGRKLSDQTAGTLSHTLTLSQQIKTGQGTGETGYAEARKMVGEGGSAVAAAIDPKGDSPKDAVISEAGAGLLAQGAGVGVTPAQRGLKSDDRSARVLMPSGLAEMARKAGIQSQGMRSTEGKLTIQRKDTDLVLSEVEEVRFGKEGLYVRHWDSEAGDFGHVLIPANPEVAPREVAEAQFRSQSLTPLAAEAPQTASPLAAAQVQESGHEIAVQKLHDLAYAMTQEMSKQGWEIIRSGEESDIVFHGNGPQVVAGRQVVERRTKFFRVLPLILTIAQGFSRVFYRGTKKTYTADADTVGAKNPDRLLLRHEDIVTTSAVGNVKEGELAFSAAVGIVNLVQTAASNGFLVLGATIKKITAEPPAKPGEPGTIITVLEDAAGKTYTHKTRYLGFTGLGLGPDAISADPKIRALAETLISRFLEPNMNAKYSVEEVKKKDSEGETIELKENTVDTSRPLVFTGNDFMYYQGTYDLWQMKYPQISAGGTKPSPAEKAKDSLFRRGVTNTTVVVGGGDSARMVQKGALHSDTVYMIARSIIAQGVVDNEHPENNISGKQIIEGELGQLDGQGNPKGQLLEGFELTGMEEVTLARGLDGRVTAANKRGEPLELSAEEIGLVKMAPGQSGVALRLAVGKIVGKGDRGQVLTEPFKNILADAVGFAIGSVAPTNLFDQSPDRPLEVKKNLGWSNRLGGYIARALNILRIGGAALGDITRLMVIGPLANKFKTGNLATAKEIADTQNINKSPDSLQVLIHRTQEAVRDEIVGLTERFGDQLPFKSRDYAASAQHRVVLDPEGRSEFVLSGRKEMLPEFDPMNKETPNPGVTLAYARLMLIDSFSGWVATPETNDNFPTMDFTVELLPAYEKMKVTVTGASASQQAAIAAAMAKHPDLAHYLREIAPRYGGKVRMRMSFLADGRLDRQSFQVLTNEEYAATIIEHDIREHGGTPSEQGERTVLGLLRSEKIDSPIREGVEGATHDDVQRVRANIARAVERIYTGQPDYRPQDGAIQVEGPFKADSDATFYVIKVGGKDAAVLNIFPSNRYAAAALSIRGAYVLAKHRSANDQPYGMQMIDIFRMGQGETDNQIGILWRASPGESVADIISGRPLKKQPELGQRTRTEIVARTMENLGRMSRLGTPVEIDDARYLIQLRRHGLEGASVNAWTVGLEHGRLIPKHVYFDGNRAQFAGLFGLETYQMEGGQVFSYGDARRDMALFLVSLARDLNLDRSSEEFRKLERQAAAHYLMGRGVPPKEYRKTTDALIASMAPFYAEAERR